MTILGFGMVITFMVLIMTRRLSPMVALIAVPILFAVVGGFGGHAVGVMMLDGIKTLAPTGVMLMFAILYFAVMIDAGLFDPIVRRILRLVGGDPLKVLVGTAILAATVSLDGDGSTTYMITIASMLPLYRRLGMNPLSLTCVAMLASGVMNLTPWGGPLARAASALHVDPADVFLHMLPAMAVGVAGVVGLAYVLGRAERRRLGVLRLSDTPAAALAKSEHAPAMGSSTQGGSDCTCRPVGEDFSGDSAIDDAALLPTDPALRRPRLLLFNAGLTAALMAALVLQFLPMPILFMVGLAVALVVNYPKVDDQRERLAEHAKNVIAVVALIFAAGIFTGILSGTGMVGAMSKSFLALIPDAWGPHLAGITAIASMPFTFFISNDAFYYGVLPIVTEAANSYGISDAEMARASLLGQPVHLLSPLVPSTYLLVGLAGVDFGDHQRFALKWAVAICVLMTVAALATGAFPAVAS
nr:CitMHS family transporter [Sphingomonas sp. ID1715]